MTTLRQKKLAPFHFCFAKISYPLPPFSFSSQTRFAGLCSEPHMLGTICPEEFSCVTGHPPAPYTNKSGLILMTSPLLLYLPWSTMQMLTIKVPNRAKRYNRITSPKTGRKNLGKSMGSGPIFSNLNPLLLGT